MNPRVTTGVDSRAAKGPVRFLTFKLAMLALLCAVPTYGLISMGVSGVWLPAAIYLLMSAIAFALYGHDKQQARAQGRRIPEKILHAAALFGGWPGALLAQQVFRHKTRKLSFQLVFWSIVLLHQLFWIDRYVLGGHLLSRHFY